VRLGLTLPQFGVDPHVALDAARHAEDLGFDSVAVFDHLWPPGGSPNRPALECFTMLGALAVATSRVTVLPLVVRAGLRPPAVTARAVATLADLAPGRFVLGLGAGDALSAPEDRAAGLPVLDQDARRAQVVDVLDAVAGLGNPGADVPVWLGGRSAAIQRLAGERATGWNAWEVDPDELRRGATVVAEAAAATGRPAPETTWGGRLHVGPDDVESVAAQLRAMAAAGASECVVALTGADPAGQRARLAAEVRPLI
jgi:alkanesulfonate monooxygenase SsuD/methylene tetrahydromethanopterin reductase-like flavin-dependent oxidoreductase (luciferase family)